MGITHPVNLGAAVPGKLYTTEFEFDPSLLGEGQYSSMWMCLTAC